MRNFSTPPSHLGPDGKRLWREVQNVYGIHDPGGRALLQVAAEALDRLRQAREAIDRDGLLVAGQKGRPAAHPAAVIEKEARRDFMNALARLNLDLEPLADGPGRPAGGRKVPMAPPAMARHGE